MKIRIIPALAALLLLLSGCEVTETTAFEPKITLFTYAVTDSSLDSVYISRNSKMNEQVSFYNLKLSGVIAKFYANDSLVGQLSEYASRPGVYYLPDSINFKFEIGKKYKLTASYLNYKVVSAETVCPDTLKNLNAMIVLSETPMNNGGKIDSIEYLPGSSFLDGTYFEGRFDDSDMLGKRLGIFQVTPEQREQSNWLEDTTQTVWKDYAKSVQFFKNKEQFGKDFYYWFSKILYVNWLAFYSKGMHDIRFGSMDEARYRYLIGANDPDAVANSNVVNGDGLFTITSYNKKVYKVFVKDSEPNNFK